MISATRPYVGSYNLSKVSRGVFLRILPPHCACRNERTFGIQKTTLLSRHDEEAAQALVQRLYPTIRRSVRSRLPRRTSEEDMVQAVFAKVFSKLDHFSGLVPLEHWVSRIAINTCINQLKYESIRCEFRWADLSEEEEAAVHDLASTNDNCPGDQRHATHELLQALFAHLKPDERLVITLLHLEERSTEEISRMTGWSISRVKVKAFRTRRKMRRFWKTSLKGER